MAKGISIHIGVNKVNRAYYHGQFGNLTTCEADALAMLKIAQAKGYKARPPLLTTFATRDAVRNAIKSAATALEGGDILLITYSGHGMSVPDKNHDEQQLNPNDKMDEAWCLYDGGLIDDELYTLWSLFRENVRILVVSDSCHSGTVISDMFSSRERSLAIEDGEEPEEEFPFSLADIKSLPANAARKTYQRERWYYDGIQKQFPAGDKVALAARILLLSACQDGQVAMEGDRLGVFTKALLKVWKNGFFSGKYDEFYEQIKIEVQKVISPGFQLPNYFPSDSRGDFGRLETPFQI